MTDMTAEQALAAVHDLISDPEGISDNMDLMYKLKQVESFLAGAVQISAALTAPRVPEFLSAKNGLHWPRIGDICLIRLNGILQNDTYEFDQGDDGNGGGQYFWGRDDIDECPAFNPELDEWLPLKSLLTAAPALADELVTLRERVRELEAFRLAVIGWRESDWCERFCRYTAEMIAQHGMRCEEAARLRGGPDE